MLDFRKLKLGAYELGSLADVYFWSDAEKAKVIADITWVAFLFSALVNSLLSLFYIETLHIAYENLSWAANISIVSALYFYAIRSFANLVGHSSRLSRFSLILVMLGMTIFFPLLFSTMGLFDGFSWSALFIFAALGYVVLEPKYVVATQIMFLPVMIFITVFEAEFPFTVRAYMHGTASYVKDLSDADLYHKWIVMSLISFLSMIVLSYMSGAWQRRESDLRSISYKDELTGIMNRRSILEGLDREMALALEEGKALSIAMLDLDYFKKVNDTYGHLFGDQALKLVANKVREVCRKRDLVGRYGGEEFLIVFPNCSGEQAKHNLERLQESLAQEVLQTSNGESVSFSFSAGVAQYETGNQEIFSLIEKADLALYQAKKNGRKRVEKD